MGPIIVCSIEQARELDRLDDAVREAHVRVDERSIAFLHSRCNIDAVERERERARAAERAARTYRDELIAATPGNVPALPDLDAPCVGCDQPLHECTCELF